MISPEMENVYNIVLSIFLGIVLVLIFNKLFNNPRTITIYKKD